MSFFSPALAWWQFLLLGLIPPLIVLLYFLKLKRHPIEVPSTYLWSQTIEDLHVNTIWQKLRQSLLLLLQILLVLLIILTLLRPGWRGTQLEGERFIYLIDVSASMSATDGGESRIEQAKKQVQDHINQMQRGQAAMIITCSDKAQVELSYRTNKKVLLKQLESIRPSSRRTDLTEALRYSSGLANPDRTRLEGNDPIDESRPATLFILSDGGVKEIKDFIPGKLTLQYLAMGEDDAKNVAITSFTTQRNTDKPGKIDVFVRLENYGSEDAPVNLKLFREEQFIDAATATVPSGGSTGTEFELEEFDDGVLRLEIAEEDDLAVDNKAWAVINAPRKAQVLLVSEGNTPMALALSTGEAGRIADVRIVDPGALKTEQHKELAGSGQLDLIIYDRCAPEEMPQANTFFIGSLPPGDEWKKNNKSGSPAIIDSDASHPLMQLVSTNNISIVDAFGIEGPQGKTVLIDADIGPLLAVGPRAAFEDLVMSFEIMTKNADGEFEPATTWPLRRSFPVFLLNMLRYLGGGSGGEGESFTVQPGDPVQLKTDSPAETLIVTSPSGKTYPVARNSQDLFVHTVTEEMGVYDVRAEGKEVIDQRFAVNLFDPQESNIIPRDKFDLPYEPVERSAGVSEKRKDIWKWVLLLGLAVLVFEWYVYNKRVYF